MQEQGKQPTASRGRRVFRAQSLLAAMAAVCALAAVGAPTAPASNPEATEGDGAVVRAKASKIHARSAIALPENKRCVRRHRLTLRLRPPRRDRWTKVAVKVNGTRFAVLKRREIMRGAALKGLPDGRFIVAVKAKTRRGKIAKASRRYRSCAQVHPPEQKPPPVSEVPPATPAPEEPQEEVQQPPAADSSPAVGSYSGRTRQAENIFFYVSADGKRLLDVSVPRVDLGCVPGKNFTNHLEIGEVAIEPDGSFAAKTTQGGTLEGAPAQFTYTLSGHFHGFDTAGRARFGGIMREDIAFDNGTVYTCSSNNQSWDALRD